MSDHLRELHEKARRLEDALRRASGVPHVDTKALYAKRQEADDQLKAAIVEHNAASGHPRGYLLDCNCGDCPEWHVDGGGCQQWGCSAAKYRELRRAHQRDDERWKEIRNIGRVEAGDHWTGEQGQS